MSDTVDTSQVDYFSVGSYTAVQAIDVVLAAAVRTAASDIHCDPTAEHIVVRFRIDGVMEHAGIVPLVLHEEFIARLKILAGVRTDLHTVPQDGRWKADIAGGQFHIRISFMPTYHGENAVLRLLPVHDMSQSSFAKLGFIPDDVRQIHTALEKTNGLVLVVGPTGSGKTTTLHTCLTLKSREPLSIITLEDPVEYEIAGVRQIHVRHSHGVTFAGGLRATLRQDPDVIMVGEIRDTETARVAIHTALTGHLVFSTLHTNSALETIPRLLDMGVDHYLLASTLRLIVAQRLVRMLCKGCEGGGCAACRQSGYLGRSIIAEACTIDPPLSAMIANKVSSSTLLEYVQAHGFRSIVEDGLEKVEWGVTSRAEVMRVLSE